MNEKSFIRKSQKIIARAMNAKVEVWCKLRRNYENEPVFEITHFDDRYEGGNHTITAYSFDYESKFKAMDEFVSGYEKGETPLLTNDY